MSYVIEYRNQVWHVIGYGGILTLASYEARQRAPHQRFSTRQEAEKALNAFAGTVHAEKLVIRTVEEASL